MLSLIGQSLVGAFDLTHIDYSKWFMTIDIFDKVPSSGDEVLLRLDVLENNLIKSEKFWEPLPKGSWIEGLVDKRF
jgi:hypothetical protein